jgi:hypothetical protein
MKRDLNNYLKRVTCARLLTKYTRLKLVNTGKVDVVKKNKKHRAIFLKLKV